MTFIIQWQERGAGAEHYLALPTPAGSLMLTLQGDVIVKTDWQIEFSGAGTTLCLEQHSLKTQFAKVWQNPSLPVEIKLLKQGSPFQNKVWHVLSQIPYGRTQTYSAIAKMLGSAARAVGGACRNNPYPLLIPCHRVVAVSGMGGYSGQTEGELMDIKAKLLAHETEHRK